MGRLNATRERNSLVGQNNAEPNVTACNNCDIWKQLCEYKDLEEAGRLIEVRYGEWKPVLFDSVCSLCGYSETTPLMIMRRDFKYCPNCGAKMELKELEGDKE